MGPWIFRGRPLGITLIVHCTMTPENTSPQPAASPAAGQTPHSQDVFRAHFSVPIRALGANERGRILAHLMALSPQDRYMRFGYTVSDEHVQRYVDSLDFERDELLGIYNRRLELLGMAHVAYSRDAQAHAVAEFGVSVLPKARGRGYGARLFERAAIHARNEGVELFMIYTLSENSAMLKIARKAGASVVRDGGDAEAMVRLRPRNLDSQVAEMVETNWAEMDYALKAQARHFRQFVRRLVSPLPLIGRAGREGEERGEPGTEAAKPAPENSEPEQVTRH